MFLHSFACTGSRTLLSYPLYPPNIKDRQRTRKDGFQFRSSKPRYRPINCNLTAFSETEFCSTYTFILIVNKNKNYSLLKSSYIIINIIFYSVSNCAVVSWAQHNLQ
jgi:hypothetical protein